MELSSFTHKDIPVERVTEAASRNCSSLLILGEDHDGNLYAASSTGDLHQILWWMEDFRFRFLRGDFFSSNDFAEQESLTKED